MSLKQNSFFNIVDRWIKSVDLVNITLILFLMIFGLLFVTSASPSVAKIKELSEYYFIKKHYIFALLTIFTMIGFSFFSMKGLINISFIGFIISIFLIAVLFILNKENNGAVRWISLAGFSLQPSEFLKPFVIIIFAFLLNFKKKFILYDISLNGKTMAF